MTTEHPHREPAEPEHPTPGVRRSKHYDPTRDFPDPHAPAEPVREG